MTILFISHPDVVIDHAAPIPRWRLSDKGVARMRAFLASDAVADVREVDPHSGQVLHAWKPIAPR